MGHIRLGRLPKTHRWQQVIDFIEVGADSSSVADASFNAIQKGLEQGADDPGLHYAFYLLSHITYAAREENLGQALQNIGLDVADNPSLLEISTLFTEAVDDYMRAKGGKTDLSEIAQMTASETLMQLANENTVNLFSQSLDVQAALKKCSTNVGFGNFARTYFSNLLNRYIKYYLSRELPNHLGQDKRFKNLDQLENFNHALEHHCHQASLIVEKFAGGWYSKHHWQEGITLPKTRNFVQYSFKKLKDELAVGGVTHE